MYNEAHSGAQMAMLGARRTPWSAIGLCLTLNAIAPASGQPRGVVFEHAPSNSELVKAGLKPGDIIQSWTAGTARGSIESPFDFAEIGTKHGSRGVVVLEGLRGGEHVKWRVLPVAPAWDVSVRPVLGDKIERLYRECAQLAASGKLEEAAQRLKEAATTVGERDPPWLAAWLTYRAAELLETTRKWDLIDELNGLAIERSAGIASYARAQILASWARTYYNRDWNRAAELLKQAIDASRGTENLSLALYTYSFGFATRNLGRFTYAELYYRSALSIAERAAPNTLAAAYYLNNAGSLAISRNELVKAEDYLTRALAIRSKIAPDTVYTLLNNLGALAFSQDEFAKAGRYYEQALSLLDRTDPTSERRAQILSNLASLAIQGGDLPRAKDYYSRALVLATKLAPGTLDEAVALQNAGGIALRTGDYAGAEQHYTRALELATKLAADSLIVAQALTDLGTLAATRGNPDQAEQYHRRALAIREKLAPGGRDHADSMLRIGAALRDKGRTAEATKCFADGLSMLERSALETNEEALSDARARFASHYRAYVDLLVEQNEPERAFQALESSRARGFLALLAQRAVSPSSEIPAELKQARQTNYRNYERARDQLLTLSPTQRAQQVESLQGRLRALDLEREQIAEQIRKVSPRLAAVEFPQPLSVPQARDELDAGTVLLSYSVGERRTILFVVKAKRTEPGFTVRNVPIGEDDLRTRIDQFRKLIENRTQNRVALAEAARGLYELLVKPVEEELAAASRVLIVPDGPVRGLPFGALKREDGRYLAEWKPLHTVLSATVYAELKKMRDGAKANEIELVAFGDPRLPSPERTLRGLDLGRLPFSRDEVTVISGLFAGTSQVYLQQDATEERVKSLLPKSRYIHFATHASFDERLPMNTALVLSIPDHRVDGQENGLLQAWEILEQLRLNADLVVLSACRTGLGTELSGEGLIGMTRAFQYAGARSVMASLWSVDDRRTADLMKRFYKHLRDGEPKDVALQSAQREMIAAGASHPFYWAAFSLSGDWR